MYTYNILYIHSRNWAESIIYIPGKFNIVLKEVLVGPIKLSVESREKYRFKEYKFHVSMRIQILVALHHVTV